MEQEDDSTILPPWLNREALRKSREARGISVSSEELEEIYARCKWFFHDVYYVDTYMTAAFRSSAENQVYLFIGNEYVLLNYAPSMHDFVIDGPNLCRRGLRGLADAPFGECRISCAFGSHRKNHAFVFSGSSCAEIKYSPPATKVDELKYSPPATKVDELGDLKMLKPTTDVKILKEHDFTRIFPFLNRTTFVHSGLDAAFESSTPFEAYIFGRDKCAHINYHHRYGHLIFLHNINVMFSCLKSTIFESGIDAAFATHRTEEAYLFKEGSCVLINYARDYLVGGVKNILEEWPSLNGKFPRKNNVHVSDSEEEEVVYSDDESSDEDDDTDNNDKNSEEVGSS